MPVCDVCSRGMNFSEGYALTTAQVAGSVNYWKFMLETHSFDESLLLMYAQQQSVQNSGWLVCESCSIHFDFDRNSARSYAQRQDNPPGSGPADINRVAGAAAAAWKMKHGRLPSWVR